MIVNELVIISSKKQPCQARVLTLFEQLDQQLLEPAFLRTDLGFFPLTGDHHFEVWSSIENSLSRKPVFRSQQKQHGQTSRNMTGIHRSA